MTYEEAKDYLNRGYRTKERIRAKEDRIAHWRQIAESITAEIKDVVAFSSTPSNKVADCASNIVDLQREIQAEIDNLIRVEREIGKAIDGAELDNTLKALLEMRYLNYYKWEEIAVALNITFRWTLSLHKKAVTIFSESALIHADLAL